MSNDDSGYSTLNIQNQNYLGKSRFRNWSYRETKPGPSRQASDETELFDNVRDYEYSSRWQHKIPPELLLGGAVGAVGATDAGARARLKYLSAP